VNFKSESLERKFTLVTFISNSLCGDCASSEKWFDYCETGERISDVFVLIDRSIDWLVD